MLDNVFRIFAYGVGEAATARAAWGAACTLSGPEADKRFRWLFPPMNGDPMATLRTAYDRVIGYTHGPAFAVLLTNSRVWGGAVWQWLHAVSTRVDPDNAVVFNCLLTGLWALLPCPGCAAHFRVLVASHRTRVDGVRTASEALALTLELHNQVTARVHGADPSAVHQYPTTFTASAEEHLQKLEGARASRRGHPDPRPARCNCATHPRR